MAKYLIVTRATVIRHYEVEAADPKEAEAKSCDASAVYEEDENEETLSAIEQG